MGGETLFVLVHPLHGFLCFLRSRRRLGLSLARTAFTIAWLTCHRETGPALDRTIGRYLDEGQGGRASIDLSL